MQIKPIVLVTVAFSLTPAAIAGGIGFGGINYPTPARPDGIASGDFDNDQDIDLAVAADTPDKVSILRNNGDGTFAAALNIPTGAGTGPNFVRAVDIDGDTDLDLAVTLHNTNQVLILSNNGTGTFTAAGTFGVGLNPRWIAAIRVDPGSTMDLVVANRDASSIAVLLNNGNTTFTSATYPVGAEPRAITIADLNRDGRFEILVSCHGDRTIRILHNDGTGQLSPGPTLSVGSELRPVGIVAADLDHDGDADIAAATSGNNLNFASVFINNAGTLNGPVHYPTGGINPGHIGATDLDRDGDVDLVTVNEGSNTIAALSNNGNATFAAPQAFSVGLNPQALTIADFDRDTMPDIVVTNQDSDNTTVLINSGSPSTCYANCDGSTATPVLSANDFVCFLNRYVEGQAYSNCDASTGTPALTANDFVCFLSAYASGCS
jgi:hypothetical protein